MKCQIESSSFLRFSYPCRDFAFSLLEPPLQLTNFQFSMNMHAVSAVMSRWLKFHLFPSTSMVNVCRAGNNRTADFASCFEFHSQTGRIEHQRISFQHLVCVVSPLTLEWVIVCPFHKQIKRRL